MKIIKIYKIFILIILVGFLFKLNLKAEDSKSNLENFDIKGHGIIAYKNKDFIKKEQHVNHAFSYGRLRFLYYLFPELLINYELYIEESSISRSYYSKNKVLGYFQGVYENIIWDKFYTKIILGNLERITFGAGLTYKEYEGKGFFYKIGYKDFYIQHYGIGIGYISFSDVYLNSIGWQEYINLNIIFIPTDNSLKITNVKELIITINSKINVYKEISVYLEIGKEAVVTNYNIKKIFTEERKSGGLIGIEGILKNKWLKSINSLELRGYEKQFNDFHNIYTDNDYTPIEAREKSINNWRNYFTMQGKVYGLFFKTFNDIEIIYDFYFNLDIEFLRLKYEKSAFNLNIYQTGIKYIFNEYTQAFMGIGNRNLQIPVLFTHELSAYPYYYAYFKFGF